MLRLGKAIIIIIHTVSQKKGKITTHNMYYAHANTCTIVSRAGEVHACPRALKHNSPHHGFMGAFYVGSLLKLLHIQCHSSTTWEVVT